MHPKEPVPPGDWSGEQHKVTIATEKRRKESGFNILFPFFFHGMN